MGYTTKSIAVVTEPARYSLSAQTNFVQFESKARVRSAYSATVQINALAANPAATQLNITEPSGAVHSFIGTANKTLVGGSTFYISTDRSDTAENLRQALLADPWIAANFNVKVPFEIVGGALANGRVISIISNGYGSEFNISISAPLNVGAVAYLITVINPTSTNNDSISGEATTAEISLDVYTDVPIFLGVDDAPTTGALLGNFAVTLSKTYTGDKIWFDINAPFAKFVGANVPPSTPGWFNTGTMRVIRFVAQVVGVNNFSFYQSNALYILKGYARASEIVDLSQYIYVTDRIKLLSNKPRTPYVKGQKEFLNFILSDVLRDTVGAPDWNVYVFYRAYTTEGNFIGEGQSDAINHKTLGMVNTCVLRIDDMLTSFPTAGVIKVALARDGAIISNDMEYLIRPAGLHILNQFSFLNKLGGWDSFNFDASAAEDLKVSFDTFTRTVTPTHHKGEGVEAVYAAELEDPLTVVGAPVTDEVAEWLKELAASTIVLDSDGNYVIKTEFTMPVSEGSTNMQVPTMKYRLSETYTNE